VEFAADSPPIGRFRQGQTAESAEQTLSDAKPIFKDLFPIFLSARPRPITPYYLLLSQAAQPELSALVVGTKEPRDVLRTVRRQRDRLLPRLATASTEREP